MNQHLQTILNLVKSNRQLSNSQKSTIENAIQELDKAEQLDKFKFERAENDKRVMKVMLDESIQDLERKTKAIEAQKRELEVEAALERVRTQVMAIRKSEELASVGEIIFTELKALGFSDLRNTEIIINNDPRETITSYYYSDYGVSGIIDVDCNSNPTVKTWAQDLQKADDAFAEVIIPEQEMKAWREYRLSLGYVPDPKLDKAKSVYYYSYSIGLGALSISLFKPIREDGKEILRQFRNVFNLAYQRYHDIALAEAQAREAQIEAALEKIRSRTMGMQKSEELPEVANRMFVEIQSLGIPVWSTAFNIFSRDKSAVTCNVSSEGQLQPSFTLPLTEEKSFKEWFDAMARKDAFFVQELGGKDLKHHYEYLFTLAGVKDAAKPLEDKGISLPTYQINHICSFEHGFLLFITYEKVPDAHPIFRRFTSVFEQTYTRFLDLQKAEAQAREAQIEAALERVRSRSMAMHHTSELQDVINTVHQQFKLLDIAITGGVFIAINAENKDKIACWGAGGTADYVERVHIPFLDRPIYTGLIEGIKKGPGFFTEEFSYKEKIEFFDYLFKHPPYVDTPPERKKEIMSRQGGYTRSCTVSKYTSVFIINHHGQRFSEEDNNILIRFGNVFEQSYTRFLDLQKAEAQAREAQIEAALERVRSRTMAMQKSEELKEVIQLVYEQFVHLNIHIEHTGFIMDYKARDDMHIWLADEHEVPSEVTIPYFDCAHWNSFIEAKEKGKDFFANHLSFEEKNKFYLDLFKLIPGVPQEIIEYYLSCPGLAISTVLLENVGLYIENFSGIPYKYEENNTLMRFGKVFQQTYTRFLDLQKAEAQAREAQIEAALERVRARTMAMHESNELSETAAVLFQQFNELGIAPERFFIGILNEEEGEFEIWATEQGGNQISNSFVAAIDEPTAVAKIFAAWKKGKPNFVIDLQGEDLSAWVQYVREQMGMPFQEIHLREHRIHCVAFFSQGMIGMTTPDQQSPETMSILERFAGVFDLTYRRFLDLKQAEEQAREAQIEAALERVRARAMAMHHSDDLASAVAAVFEELQGLGLRTVRCGIGIIDGQTRRADIWTTASTDQGDSVQVSGDEILAGHPLLEGIFDAWQRQQSFSYFLQGEDLARFYKVVADSNFQLPVSTLTSKAPTETQQHYYCVMFPAGGLYAFRQTEFSAEAIRVMRRFADVFHLAYTRYQDLQKAEARAREAEQQASLDRVRAEIASMRTAGDLQRITPIIWRELTTLGVPFFRCGIFIIDEATEHAHVYLSTPTGEAVAALKLKFDSAALVEQAVQHWRQRKVYREEWERKQFIAWTQSLIDQGLITSPEQYQAGEKAPEKLVLHFVPFTQGMLYVGNTSPLTDEKLQLVKTLAEAFSIAYARYEDFKNLEEAKKRVEETLNELKSTQAQLIHSEKMASLGELTAGIAHEIKNPLNFVNNFSEISRELLDELKEELQNENKEEVFEIVADLIQNLEKINQHGKRADSVVKGMLLHSRGSSGEKTLTDVNELLDQYVNLAYHGMRAQDKEFNITIEKNYDKTIEKITTVPQDIGRVFLNIINNACYAANQRKKANGADFSPTLKVSTKNLKNKVEIRIRDNGGGIPTHLLDKIFQPFFTTKPTGEGTGLGLSLSYDIITKVHGGELQVETKEGEGTEMRIILNRTNPENLNKQIEPAETIEPSRNLR